MRTLFSFLLTSLLLSGCAYRPDQIDPAKITSINIIDRNGLSETVNSKERLEAFQKTDFLAAQPYQKVMRVYGREKNGDIRSCITSYHPNGEIKQYLEATNQRACGSYREWYSNGILKVEAHVIGGMADLNTQAEQSWLFDGVSRAWNEEGKLMAEIRYAKGELEGPSIYYHPNGAVWKHSPHEKGALHGTQKVFLENGALFQVSDYKRGEKEGLSLRYWENGEVTYRENYEEGRLMEAQYFDLNGKLTSKITQGNGERALFGREELHELHTYKNGVQEGEVKVFDSSGHLISLYSVKFGDKHGEEIDYFPSSRQPKLLLTWNEGLLQGPVKTWYENGQLESQREMSGNKKNGLLTAWYRNGSLMFVEEYENDKLLKGEYYRLGERASISQVLNGKGVATLFNPEGSFSRKIYYQEGYPLD